MAASFAGPPDTLTAIAASLGVTITRTPEPGTIVAVWAGLVAAALRREKIAFTA